MNILSETNKLERVLLHRPGNELNSLNQSNKNDFLFDEIPNLEIAQKEHDDFAKTLRNNDVEVDYLDELMAEVIKNKEIKEEFIKQYLGEANFKDEETYNYLLSIKDEKQLVRQTMSGIENKIKPMPNLYFTRDPFTIIDNGIALYHMHTNIRNREVIYGEFVNKYHPDFNLQVLYNRNSKNEIEGGDVLILDEKAVCIGISERTSFEGAYELALNLLKKTRIKNIITVEFPKKRAYMHLDTVMTKLNDDTFSLYNEFYDRLKIKIINKDGVNRTNDDLKVALSKLLNKNIKFIESANDSEQWNDAYNTLAILPNKVIVFEVNKTTNNIYNSNGIQTLTVSSTELLKGRGGFHCMSMPLIRKSYFD